MSDHLAAKREARRRKILTNSENRLKQITGRDESRAPVHFSDCETEVNGLVKHSDTLNGWCIDQQNEKLSEFSCPSMQSIESFPQNLSTTSENIPPNGYDDIPESISHNPLYQVGPSVYITMAVLFRIFLEFNSDAMCHNMIVAFLMIQCSSILLFGIQSAEMSPLIHGIFILSGISPQKIRFIVKAINVSSVAIGNFSMFTFSFVLSDTFIYFFKSLI